MKQITIYTDGSCQTQTRIGGWAAVLSCGEHRKVISGSMADTTVNAMELTAVVNGLNALKEAHQTVTLYTDSNYVARGANEWLPDWVARDWLTASKQPVANRDLWEQLHTLMQKHTATVTWIPREQNAEADKLAQQARMMQAGCPVDGDDTSPVTPEVHIMIAGSRYASREALDYARRVVRRAHQQGHTIIVGDNPKGVDMAVVRECRRLKARVIVVGVTSKPRNGGCSHGSYVKVEQGTYRAAGGQYFQRYHVRDRWMVDNANRGIFIWNGSSPGTKQGYEYMVVRSKDAHLVTFEKGVGRE
jgi:ribonuclease HI